MPGGIAVFMSWASAINQIQPQDRDFKCRSATQSQTTFTNCSYSIQYIKHHF